MKRALLTIAILLFTGLSADLLAQRTRQDNRQPRREEALNNKREGKKPKNNNRGYKAERTSRVVDRRVTRDRGWSNYGYSNTVGRSNVRYYDYDFRTGRRIQVNRGRRPSNNHIWIAGHSRYSPRFRRDVWVDGRWSIRRANHRWVPGRYQRLNGVRVWIAGCWSVVY